MWCEFGGKKSGSMFREYSNVGTSFGVLDRGWYGHEDEDGKGETHRHLAGMGHRCSHRGGH